MVAKITCPTSVRRALNYNEQKVQQGKAKCIHAGNYLKDHDQMNFHEKLERFTKQIELSKAKTNTLHISLNFDPADKIDTDKMLSIAKDYMQKIGFGNQPYMVYEHNDAGHPHLHIVTTNIREDGKRMDTYKIGEKVSEPARKAIEKEYGLIQAEGRKQQQLLKQTEPAQSIQYGKSETKRSITNVLDAVIDKYKYSSLAELNAVLRLFNVEADRGKEGSRIYEKRGLTYRIIDGKGNKIGVPIKASSIYSKPTLEKLEKKFAANEVLKATEKSSLTSSINWVLAKQPVSLRDFIEQLAQEKISVVLRQSDKGQIYGLTYIDHNAKIVFNGSDLGKNYSAKAIQETLNRSPDKEQSSTKQQTVLIEPATLEIQTGSTGGRVASFKLLENLLQPENDGGAMAADLREEERKKRRRSIDHEHEL